jgi:3-hydroxyisobutyrate dehydrogenase
VSVAPTLDGVLSDVFASLTRGVADRRHDYHQPVVCTADADGTPDARTVVLRAFDADRRSLRFHTDARSPKVGVLGTRPTVAWLFYDTKHRVQLRIAATAVVRTGGDDAIVAAAWAKTNAWSRRCYLAPRPPSSAVEGDGPSANVPGHLMKVEPTLAESEAGLANFAVVDTTITRVDWLHLKHDGHERAVFSWGGDGAVAMGWVEP